MDVLAFNFLLIYEFDLREFLIKLRWQKISTFSLDFIQAILVAFKFLSSTHRYVPCAHLFSWMTCIAADRFIHPGNAKNQVVN